MWITLGIIVLLAVALTIIVCRAPILTEEKRLPQAEEEFDIKPPFSARTVLKRVVIRMYLRGWISAATTTRIFNAINLREA